MKTSKRKPNGYVLFETAWIVAIATGFRRRSENVKTGDMIQIWILNRNLHPVVAQQTGKDKVVCGNCPLRPALAAKGEPKCYVNTLKAPTSVWRAYQAGSYPRLGSIDVFEGRAVRFGAYGDPSKLPLPLISDIAGKASRWVGYTHQWRDALKQGYKRYLMASVDDVAGQIEAAASGWRTFRASPKDSRFTLKDEIKCPASKEAGARVQCADCGLCNGADGRKIKNIEINLH